MLHPMNDLTDSQEQIVLEAKYDCSSSSDMKRKKKQLMYLHPKVSYLL
jgi:hypothetical protein